MKLAGDRADDQPVRTLRPASIPETADRSSERTNAPSAQRKPGGSRFEIYTRPDHLIRTGGAIAAGAELVYLYVLLAEVLPALRTDVVLIQVANASVGIALIWSSYQRWFKNYWRILSLAGGGILIVNTLVTTLFTGDVEWLLLTIITIVVGAAALAPWTTAWQSALSVVALAAFAAASRWIDTATVHWLEISVAIALGELMTRFGMRYRRELELQLAALLATESRLRAEAEERAVAQRRAQASEKTMQTIFQAIPDPMVVRRMSDGKVVRCNKYISSYGYDQSTVERAPEILDQAWANPAERERFTATLRKYGSVRNVEVALRKPDGEIAPSLLSAVLADIDGEECAVTIARDITEIRRAEQQLREREEMFRKVFDRTSDAISINRISDGAYVEVNRAFLKANRLDRKQIIGRSDVEVGLWVNQEDRDQFARLLRRNGGARNEELEFCSPDGGVVHWLVNAALLRVAGEPCVAVFGHDITASKNNERELRQAREELSRQVEALKTSQKHIVEREEMLRRIFDANLDSLVITDMETGKYLQVNQEFLRLTGFKREDVIGSTHEMIRLWPYRHQREIFVRDLLTKGSVRNLEADFDLKGGERIHCLVSAIILELGGRRCSLSLARDVTELKETEHELIAAREAALAASRAKSEFLSSMSHEIRTPMNSILGMADLLAETTLNGEQRHYVESVVTNGNSLLELINSILDLARVESGRLPLDKANFDLRELVESAAATLAVAAHGKNLELTARLAPGTPTALVGDPMRVRQVLLNLVGNAIKFTNTGEIGIEVKPDPAEPGRLLFSIRDTGIGIPAEKVQTLFEPFTQADSSTTRKYGGSGLGLAIARRLVKLMDGDIEITSSPGEGSTFRFSARFEMRSDKYSVPEFRPDFTGVRILLVDDVASARAAVAEMLSACGASITETESGETALVAARRAKDSGAPFSLAIIDAKMPGIDGCQTARELIRLDLAPKTIVLLLCTDDLRNNVHEIRKLGLSAWVAKPVRRMELLEVVSRALDMHLPPAIQPAADEHAAGTPAEGGLTDESAMPREVRILLADDSVDNRLLVRAYLRKTPYRLDEAANGREAIEMFKKEQYDLVLMDIQMPEVDGYEATSAIRLWEREHGAARTPIFALTASALGDAADRSIMSGCDAHITKPVKKATLLASIREAIQAERGAARKPQRSPAEG